MKRKRRFQNPWGKGGEYYNQSAVGGSTSVEPPTSLVSGDNFHTGQTSTETPSSTTDSINAGRLLQYEDEETEAYKPWSEDDEYYPNDVLDSKDPNDPKSVLYTTAVVQSVIPKLTIVEGGVNSPLGRTDKGANNLAVTFVVTGGKDIQKIEVTQFVSVTLSPHITIDFIRQSKGKGGYGAPDAVFNPQTRVATFLDIGQNGNISYHTDADIVRRKSEGNYAIYPNHQEAAIFMDDNPEQVNRTNDEFSTVLFTTYVSVVNSKGKRTVVGRIYWGYNLNWNERKWTPMYVGTPKVEQVQTFSPTALKVLSNNKIKL